MELQEILEQYDKKRIDFIPPFFTLLRCSRPHGLLLVTYGDNEIDNKRILLTAKLLAETCLKCISFPSVNVAEISNTELLADAMRLLEYVNDNDQVIKSESK
ncbi:hypothetical protein DO021_15450 [Desulfobacter hydrogenophilus]|uniref:Uncharacterized protein n=1 Tax=Desulfobacter hydrogenophilus TaxID=2291 RepID=A0A328FDA3_9BACT|nr:hypothetical protein [Desulfobacter hydrogenophilus]NDY73077.1 hypothetical protein [Desulfobacter hydrogenophilus]QBH13573.1 hypothetical protein EYB58_11935 [Desulfobacter hydrogenophilus]RAM01083.1 hypothetical protein DO021_15450 [Desulfobacter hydrogenophilus]